jgi:mono/diheme cytochrome c family protein
MRHRVVRQITVAFLAGGFAVGGGLALAAAVRARADATSRELPASTRSFPRPDLPAAELVARGRKLFLGSCAHCHGGDARGDEGPDLHGLHVSDRRIATVLRTGIKGEMPSFAKKHGPDEIAELISYLRTLQ